MQQTSSLTRDHDVAVIGGGLVGSAIAWGLARAGQRVAVLDEGDVALRASRGNFALVWVQSKGLGMPAYARWTVQSVGLWDRFADELKQQTGIDVSYQRPGGFHLALGEAELEKRAALMARLQAQPGMPEAGYEMLDREQVRRMLPAVGPEVVGGSFCPLDGHVNSLRLLRAQHQGMQQMGVAYVPNAHVDAIDARDGGFAIRCGTREIRAGKVVLTAGIGNRDLGRLVGLEVPVRPQRGQLIVTEKTAPFLHHPIVTLRQTDEGGVMIGDSQEEKTDPVVGQSVISVMAERAQRMFPQIGGLNVVRTWAALRVMTQDGFPIYEQSTSHPGAFVATCHSGVTLAANHALALAPCIVAGSLPAEQFDVFSARRFHVPAAA